MQKYLIDYHINGHEKFFEFHLFVNPLGQKCYFSELAITQTTQLIHSKVDINILCIQNEYILNDFIRQLGLSPSILSIRNDVYQKMYTTSLAFKAATMQGKRKSRQYLFALQEYLQSDIHRFNDDVITNIAEEVGLDIDLFQEDFRSPFVRELYLNDLKIANKMNIRRTPSLVIFDLNMEDEGYVIEGKFDSEDVIKQLDRMMHKQCQSSCLAHHPQPLSLISRSRM